jgi:hypothetical protein
MIAKWTPLLVLGGLWTYCGEWRAGDADGISIGGAAR